VPKSFSTWTQVVLPCAAALLLSLSSNVWCEGNKPALDDTLKQTKQKASQRVEERVRRAKAAPGQAVDSTVDKVLDNTFKRVDQAAHDAIHFEKR